MTQQRIGAIEAGGTKFVVAMADEDGTVLASERIETTTPDETMSRTLGFFRQAAADFGPLGAVGVGSFGPLDVDPASPGYGTITTTPKPGWAGTSLIELLAPLGVSVMVDTDVNAAALGEAMRGAGRGCRTIAYTTVGTGIGTGVVRDGRPLAGFSHFEAGHIRVPHDRARDPFAGSCPFHGDCLEGLASGQAIKARFGTALDQAGLDATRTSGAVGTAAAVDLVAGYVADLAVNLILLHAPDRLIFGGGVIKTPGLIEALRRHTEQRLGGYIVHPALDPGLVHYVVAPGLGDGAGITGAIELGRQAIAKAKDPA